MKIAVNRCYGGFQLTKKVYDRLGIEWDGVGFLDNDSFDIKSLNYNEWRADERLIKAIEDIGVEESGGKSSNIEIVEIPDDVDWDI